MVRVVHAGPVDGIIDADLAIDRSNWDHPPHLALSQLRMDRMMPLVHLEPANPIALPRCARTLDMDALTFADPWTNAPMDSTTFLNRRLFNDALLVMHRGCVIHESYRNGMTANDHHVQHSTTKSLTTMLIAQAIDAGRMDPSAPFDRYLPELRSIAGWHDVTLQHVLDMAPGLKYVESYEDRNSDYHSYARAVGYYPATADESIGARRWLIEHMTRRTARPGTCFNYASPLTNALMMAAEHALDAPILELLEGLFQRVGAESVGWFNTDGSGFPIAEGQLSLTLRDFARWASVMISDGRNLAGQRIIPSSFIADTCAPNASARAAFNAVERSARFPRGHYRNQFWITEPQLRQFTMLGIHGQFAWFDLANELMVIGYGSFPVATSPLLTLAQQALWRRIGEALAD